MQIHFVSVLSPALSREIFVLSSCCFLKIHLFVCQIWNRAAALSVFCQKEIVEEKSHFEVIVNLADD